MLRRQLLCYSHGHQAEYEQQRPGGGTAVRPKNAPCCCVQSVLLQRAAFRTYCSVRHTTRATARA
eukprot:1978383-Heterocapsa_arctica.AAC.1